MREVGMSALGAIVSLGFRKTLPLLQFSFGGAISTLARQEGSPPRISIGASVGDLCSVGGLHRKFVKIFQKRSIHNFAGDRRVSEKPWFRASPRVEYRGIPRGPARRPTIVLHKDLCDQGCNRSIWIRFMRVTEGLKGR
jgi:hypothetical protein